MGLTGAEGSGTDWVYIDPLPKATGRPGLGRIQAGWLVKVNDVEASEATSQPVDSMRAAIAAARTMCRLGARNVIVTRGQEGAILVTADGAWLIDKPPAIGLYPVGSGDAFLGGVVAETAMGNDLLEAAIGGVAAAAANALEPGAGVLDAPTFARLRRLIQPPQPIA